MSGGSALEKEPNHVLNYLRESGHLHHSSSDFCDQARLAAGAVSNQPPSYGLSQKVGSHGFAPAVQCQAQQMGDRWHLGERERTLLNPVPAPD
jgi:hypothetical protein